MPLIFKDPGPDRDSGPRGRLGRPIGAPLSARNLQRLRLETNCQLADYRNLPEWKHSARRFAYPNAYPIDAHWTEVDHHRRRKSTEKQGPTRFALPPEQKVGGSNPLGRTTLNLFNSKPYGS